MKGWGRIRTGKLGLKNPRRGCGLEPKEDRSRDPPLRTWSGGKTGAQIDCQRESILRTAREMNTDLFPRKGYRDEL